MSAGERALGRVREKKLYRDTIETRERERSEKKKKRKTISVRFIEFRGVH